MCFPTDIWLYYIWTEKKPININYYLGETCMSLDCPWFFGRFFVFLLGLGCSVFCAQYCPCLGIVQLSLTLWFSLTFIHLQLCEKVVSSLYIAPVGPLKSSVLFIVHVPHNPSVLWKSSLGDWMKTFILPTLDETWISIFTLAPDAKFI
jgi:hypothetical protein